MKCQVANCTGTIVGGKCSACGALEQVDNLEVAKLSGTTARVEKTSDLISADPVEMLINSSFEQSGRERIVQIAEKLKLAPENSYQAWRVKADLWVAAVGQLETREIIADPSIEIFGVPLLSAALRRAAERAYRQSAHLSPSFEIRVQLIDEANRIRIPTWF